MFSGGRALEKEIHRPCDLAGRSARAGPGPLGDAVCRGEHFSEIRLVAAGQAVPHIRLQAVPSPVPGETPGQRSFSVELGGVVVPQHDWGDALLGTGGIDELEHVALLHEVALTGGGDWGSERDIAVAVPPVPGHLAQGQRRRDRRAPERALAAGADQEAARVGHLLLDPYLDRCLGASVSSGQATSHCNAVEAKQGLAAALLVQPQPDGPERPPGPVRREADVQR